MHSNAYLSDLWTPRIYGLNGLVKDNILRDKKALDIGCGQRKLSGAVGMDIVKESTADVIHDMNIMPWPFKDDSFDLVFMNHVLEHADNIIQMLGQAHRILKTNGRLIIQVPYFRSVDAFADPTHRHFFTSYSLDYFVKGTGLSNYHYAPFQFEKLGFWYGWPHASRNPIKQVIKKFAHDHPIFYDQYMSLLFPIECVTWELAVLKSFGANLL